MTDSSLHGLFSRLQIESNSSKLTGHSIVSDVFILQSKHSLKPKWHGINRPIQAKATKANDATQYSLLKYV